MNTKAEAQHLTVIPGRAQPGGGRRARGSSSSVNLPVLFRDHPDAVVALDRDTLRVLDANLAAVRQYGFDREAFRELGLEDLVGARVGLEAIASWVDAGGWIRATHVGLAGGVREVEVNFARSRVAHRTVFLMTSRPAQQSAAIEEQLRHQAFHDPLTGVANRVLLRDRIEQAVARASGGHRFVVAFIDLDHFKGVNDSVGHNAGDAVLVEVARRIVSSVRPVDTVARLGGDEFALLLDGVSDPEVALRLVQQVATALRLPISTHGDDWFLSASIGVAFSEHSGGSSQSILRSADVAMYEAKRQGRDQVVIFQPSMHEVLVERLRLENDLRVAIPFGQLRVHYQPQVDLRSARVVGVEALVRWEHPTQGLLMPADFIGLAEETGRIGDIDRWVLVQAANQMREWIENGHGDIRVGVNLSGRDFGDPGLVDAVVEILAAARVPANRFELEITETAAFEADQARPTIRRLRDAGLRVALDDFGVGFSMLSRLQDLPVDRLKLDRSFIERITFGEDEAPIVRGMIAMAHSLGLKVVGEGVETSEQLAYLRRSGCDHGQGYRLGRPGAAEAVFSKVPKS
ncbi:MAG: putative bifunctional diguanylate cyclase/phosphodiesterase [Candidatus Dormibacteria bacterium]